MTKKKESDVDAVTRHLTRSDFEVVKRLLHACIVHHLESRNWFDKEKDAILKLHGWTYMEYLLEAQRQR